MTLIAALYILPHLGEKVIAKLKPAHVAERVAILRRSGARLAKLARISTTSLHSTRHTAATTLLVSGVDVRTAAGVLGHSTPNVTLTSYAHLVADAQREGMDRLGESIEKLANA